MKPKAVNSKTDPSFTHIVPKFGNITTWELTRGDRTRDDRPSDSHFRTQVLLQAMLRCTTVGQTLFLSTPKRTSQTVKDLFSSGVWFMTIQFLEYFS